jgi:hypothetical protein
VDLSGVETPGDAAVEALNLILEKVHPDLKIH